MTVLNRAREAPKNTPEQSARIVELGRLAELDKFNAEGFPKMVVRLMGGVGNQLFQYAFGISQAARHKQRVGFTNWRCRDDKWRPAGYQLDAFVNDIKLLPRTAELGPIIQDPSFSYKPEMIEKSQGTFVGYWQTEKYFLSDVVRDKVAYRYPLSEQSLRVAERILSCGKSSAFLHVRRGADYKRSDFHAKQNLDYYTEAIKRIRETRENCTFFLFGDDVDYMRENFNYGDFVIVNHNKPDTNAAHEDMQLMSLCYNGAIANSSFSWWAAWLGTPRPDQLIFSPSQWFGGENQIVSEMGDITPDRWITI